MSLDRNILKFAFILNFSQCVSSARKISILKEVNFVLIIFVLIFLII